jgi:hypothetical protein
MKRPAEQRSLSSKQGLKLVKHHSEWGVDSPIQGKQAPVEGREDHSIDIDESSLLLKLQSKKEAQPKKIVAQKIGSRTKSVSGNNSPHMRWEPAFCTHTTPELGASSAKASLASFETTEPGLISRMLVTSCARQQRMVI